MSRRDGADRRPVLNDTVMKQLRQQARGVLRSARSHVEVARVARPLPERSRERMNGTERAYAEHLNTLIAAGVILEWKYEGITLTLGDDCRYTPDFFVVTAAEEAELHEVKAPDRGKAEAYYAKDDARVKLKVAARDFPFRMVVVWPRHGGLSAGWQRKEIGA